ncbi:MAG: LemA family protein [Desulfobacterales bacterium]|nr:LemA family protein [Desulfobacterales bacterium]
MGFLIAAAVAAAVVLYAVSIYNTLVRLRNTSQSAWSDIDVQLKKRYDLVPNLVETVKGYAAHEQGLFQKVTEARTAAMRAAGPAETARAENQFRDTLKSLFAVAEASSSRRTWSPRSSSSRRATSSSSRSRRPSASR